MSCDLRHLYQAANRRLVALGSGEIRRKLEEERKRKNDALVLDRTSRALDRQALKDKKEELRQIDAQLEGTQELYDYYVKEHNAGTISEFDYGGYEELDHLRDQICERKYQLEIEIQELRL